MSEKRRVHPDCRNASNPYHECSEFCFSIIADKMPTEIENKPSLRDPPEPPLHGIPGKTFTRKKQRDKRKTYLLQTLRTFTPENYSDETPADFQKVFYYQGLTFDEDDSSEEATFICFSDKDLAKRICRSSRRVKNTRLLRADFCNYNKVVGRYLVCFPRFEDFLAQDYAKEYFLNSMKYSKGEINGHPCPEAIDEIKAVSRGIAVCHQFGVTSTLLGKRRGYVGYVLSKGKVMILVDDDECNDADQWVAKLKKHLLEFKEGLGELIIPLRDGKTIWEERESFFNCFSRVDKDLYVITEHPFLKHNRLAILEIFEIAYHGMSTGDFGGLKMGILISDIQNKDTELCDAALIYQKLLKGKTKKVWTDFRKPSKELYDTFTQQNSRNKYAWEKVQGLIRFLKNIYSHYADVEMDEQGFVVKPPIDLDVAFEKITKYWPFFVDRVHERLYG